MKKHKAHPSHADALLSRAKKVLRLDATSLAEPPAATSPEEVQRILHELRVHHVELEMQNEELRRVHLEMDAARALYFDLYDQAPVGYVIISKAGLILEANLTAATILNVPQGTLVKKRLSGFIFVNDQDRYYLHRKRLVETGEPQACEMRMVKNDGAIFWVQMTATAAQDATGDAICRIVLNDITEYKQAELERETTVKFLQLINANQSTDAIVEAATGFLQRLAGCEAVGVRLRDGDDYPYYEAHGFPPEFICRENNLCARDTQGKLIVDPQGQPFHECMCGHIINGRFDASKPYFTPSGSFWTNSTTGLLASISDTDQIIPTRGTCNMVGYESLALLPLHSGGDRLGLVHFADHRRDMFIGKGIALWEHLLHYLSNALSKTRAEEDLRQSQARYQVLSEATFEGIIISCNGRIIDTNDQIQRMLGYAKDELTGQGIASLLPPEDSPNVLPKIMAGLEHVIEHRMLCKDGTHITVEAHGKPLGNTDQKTRITAIRDITARKQAEAVLRDSEARYRAIVDGFDGMIYICSPDYRVMFANDRLIERTGHDPIGEPCYEIINGRDSICPWCVNNRILQGETVRWEQKSPKDGRWYYIVNTPIRYADGTVAKQAMIQDITERKQIEEALRESRDTLEQRVQERSAQLRKLVSELTMTEHRERRRLAELLHDHLQQLLVAARFSITTLKKTRNNTVNQTAVTVDDQISQALAFSRSLTAELCPSILQNGGLVAALEWLAGWMRQKYGLTVELEAAAGAAPKTEDMNILLFQAVRELLFNVVKHAGVTTAGVRIRRVKSLLELTISDSGSGFDPRRHLHDSGFGLFSIRERLSVLGGGMDVNSAPGQGCSVSIRIPLGTTVQRNRTALTPGHVGTLISGMATVDDGGTKQKHQTESKTDNQ